MSLGPISPGKIGKTELFSVGSARQVSVQGRRSVYIFGYSNAGLVLAGATPREPNAAAVRTEIMTGPIWAKGILLVKNAPPGGGLTRKYA